MLHLNTVYSFINAIFPKPLRRYVCVLFFWRPKAKEKEEKLEGAAVGVHTLRGKTNLIDVKNIYFLAGFEFLFKFWFLMVFNQTGTFLGMTPSLLFLLFKAHALIMLLTI